MANELVGEVKSSTLVILCGAVLTALAVCICPAGCRGQMAGAPESASVPPSVPTSSATTARPSVATSGTTTTVAPVLATYRDRRNRFMIPYPATWTETNLRQLGDSQVYGFEVVGFADHGGPAQNGCYLDCMQINLLEESVSAENTLDTIRDNLPKSVDRLSKEYEDLRVLDSWQRIELAGSPAMTLRLQGSAGGQSFIALDCILVREERLYEIEFLTVEEDWMSYEPILLEILHGFGAYVS